MIYILFAAAVITGGYFAFRFFSLKHAIRQTDRELKEIQKDISQNQILRLPIPDGDLEKLMTSFNGTLEEVCRERQSYEKREREFQQQIENISHDLRTPLTVILGYLKFMKQLEEGTNVVQDQSEILTIIERKATSMEKLVTQFYAFSRLKAQDYEIKIGNVDICRILRETLIDNYQILEAAHLEVNAKFPDYPVWVEGESAALERIFSNLFQNAGRYAKRSLLLQIKESKENISICFVNDTEKISDHDIQHLFDRFYMQSSSRNQEGTGLGLTVAKILAEMMNGMLSVGICDDDNIPIANSKDETIAICFTLSLKTAQFHKGLS